MQTFQTSILLNEQPGHMLWRYEPGDALRRVLRADHSAFFTVEAETVEQALEKVYVIGQKEDPWGTTPADKYGRTYPLTERSVSMGDVIVVGGLGRWSVEGFGFRKVEA